MPSPRAPWATSSLDATICRSCGGPAVGHLTRIRLEMPAAAELLDLHRVRGDTPTELLDLATQDAEGSQADAPAWIDAVEIPSMCVLSRQNAVAIGALSAFRAERRASPRTRSSGTTSLTDDI
jgi:hypothetical protein